MFGKISKVVLGMSLIGGMMSWNCNAGEVAITPSKYRTLPLDEKLTVLSNVILKFSTEISRIEKNQEEISKFSRQLYDLLFDSLEDMTLEDMTFEMNGLINQFSELVDLLDVSTKEAFNNYMAEKLSNCLREIYSAYTAPRSYLQKKILDNSTDLKRSLCTLAYWHEKLDGVGNECFDFLCKEILGEFPSKDEALKMLKKNEDEWGVSSELISLLEE